VSLATHLRRTAVLATPIALAQLAQMAMGLTDTVMLGGISDRALAAGGLGANLFFTVLYALQGILGGVSVLAARALGAGRRQDVPMAYWSGMAIAMCLCIPAFALMSAPQDLLRLAGEPPDLSADVVTYLGALRWGVPAGLIGIGLVRGILPAIGLQRLLMWVIPAAVVVNAGLNICLIYGHFGLPALGLWGSGLATAISLWLTSAVLMALLHGVPSWRRYVAPVRISAGVMRELLTIGLPMGGTVLVEAALFMVTGLIVGRLGPAVLAAHMVALSVASTSFMVPYAISQAANVRVAEAVGAGRADAARQAGFAAMILALLFGSTAATVLILAPGWIVGLYVRGPAAAATATIAASLLRIAGVFQVADGLQSAASGALRGLKDTAVPMLLATLGYWGIGFCSGIFLAFDAGLGAAGLWWGLCAGLATTAVCLTARFIILTRKKASLPYFTSTASSLRRRKGSAKGGS
jgi:MATE family multidrug resistance protein